MARAPSEPITIDELPELPRRADDAHKGSVGRIAVVAGRLDEFGMVGAAALVANAAYCTGAGLVQIITPHDVQIAVAALAPCATTRRWPGTSGISLLQAVTEFGADVVAIGPGLSPAVSDDDLRELLARFEGALVVDADALNRISGMPLRAAGAPEGTGVTFAHPAKVILTPHPGEMSRLLKGWSLDAAPQDRRQSALALSRATDAVVVLKGAGTVVTDYRRTFINQTGNSGMATAGTGDVLTGVIAALCGQHMAPFDAAVLGVYLHGLAGDLAAEEIGRLAMTATDLLDFIPDAMGDVERESE
ncbi:MAG TPA: NAD(P)H-hydrate dehydratase [Phycisphaerae bacterium]|jgi:NAD(P)H-hydrate epimerase